MNAFSLTGKTLLITGASSGLGRQTAISASEAGATLILTGRNEVRLRETLEKLSGEGHAMVVADLTVDAQLQSLVASFGMLNGVFFSTGVSTLVPTGFITADKLRIDLAINYEAPVLLTSALLRKKKLQQQDCSLLYMSTVSTVYPFVGGAMYIGARAALEGYARVLALELAPKGIRVNCLRSGFVRTPMLEKTAQLSKVAVEKIENQQPLGIGDPVDVARTAVFYFSGASKWITGTNLILGGG
ncbi:MAG: SDR family oxidoreductase [Bacteroidetes bacterium]|nr:SDR family oxidoreductase [Bacteroidota bacterium]